MLKGTFLGQLVKGIDLFCDMDVITVRNIITISHALDNAKPLLQAFGELIGRAFNWSTVHRIIDVFCGLPLLARIVKCLHHCQSEFPSFLSSVRLSKHPVNAFRKTRIPKADGAIAIVQKLINGFALLETGDCTMLPKNRGNITRSSE